MTTLFEDPKVESKTSILIQRMLRLKYAVEQDVLSVDELHAIAQLNTEELATKTDELHDPENNDSLKILFDLLNNTDGHEYTIRDQAGLIAGLKQFENEHSDYLPLSPLTVENEQTLETILNDFARFYTLFIQHIIPTKQEEELGDTYTLDLDMASAKSDWLTWQHSRSTQVSFDLNDLEPPGLFEKFLSGSLKSDEWLTDLDIKRGLAILGLTDQNTQVIRFKVEDIGLAIHFERQKHELDDPQKKYTIPLIVNLGEGNHSRINSQGKHWTRLIITVTPNDGALPTIEAQYNDSLVLLETKKVQAVIKDALKYREQVGIDTTTGTAKIYTAFPACDNPRITVTGSGEQQDSFTCGYRAMQGLVSDLIKNDSLKTTPEYQTFIACKTVTDLRDYVYKALIGKQTISTEAADKIAANATHLNNVFQGSTEIGYQQIDQDLINGQLLAFKHPRSKQKKQLKLNPAQLTQLVKDQKIITEITQIVNKHIILDENDAATIELDTLGSRAK